MLGLGPLHAEVAPHDRGVRLVVDADLLADQLLVAGIEPLHHALLAQVERRADAHAHDVRDALQQMRRAPAADDRAALSGDGEDLVGSEDRQAGLVSGEALEDSGAAIEQADDVALAHAHAVGKMIDDLVVDHRQAHLFPDPAGQLLAKRAHLAGDRDDWHLRPSPGNSSRTVLAVYALCRSPGLPAGCRRPSPALRSI